MARHPRHGVVYGAPPRADLLPDRERSEELHQRTMPKLLLAILGSAAVAALIWAAGIIPVTVANQRLAESEAESQDLITQIAAFAETQQALTKVSQLEAARTQLTMREVLFMEVRDELVAELPEGAALSSFTGALPAADGSGAVVGSEGGEIDLNPLCVAETATITVKILVTPLEPAAPFIDGLEGLTGFSCVMATMIDDQDTDGVREITVQIALGPDAFSGRFVEETE